MTALGPPYEEVEGQARLAILPSLARSIAAEAAVRVLAHPAYLVQSIQSTVNGTAKR